MLLFFHTLAAVRWKTAHLFMINLACRFSFISSTFFIASTVDVTGETETCCSEIKQMILHKQTAKSTFFFSLPVLSQSTLLYLTGMFRRFSNSSELSWKIWFVGWEKAKQINDWNSAQRRQTHHCQLLSWCLSECFGPSCFSWVSLLLEVPVAFWSAESEWLHYMKKRQETQII